MSYKSFEFVFPTRILFGPKESDKAAEYALSFGAQKLMLLTYGDFRLPLLDKLEGDLKAAGQAYLLYDRCLPNPGAQQIDEAAAVCRQEGCDMVLGVGGGSVIDFAKATALLAANPSPGGIWDYVGEGKEPENRPLPLMLVVTIASTGSEGNESFVITDRGGRQKLIYNHPFVRPVLSVCDPLLSVTLPPRQTALGAVDVFSHVLEQYLHADGAADASDEMCLGLLKTVLKWAPVATAQPENIDARSNLLWCAILAMSRILGVGHEENWLSHMLEHAVSAKYDLPHAAGMAGIMPAYLAYLEKRELIPEKLEQLAEMLQAPTASEGLCAFQQRLGLPVDLKEALGFVPDEEAFAAMRESALPWGPMEAACLGVFTPEDAEAVLRSAFGE